MITVLKCGYSLVGVREVSWFAVVSSFEVCSCSLICRRRFLLIFTGSAFFFPVGFGEPWPGTGNVSFFSAPPCSLLSLLSVGSEGVLGRKMYPVTAVYMGLLAFLPSMIFYPKDQ